mmetsp:Transcript_22761/g.64652  ORF Transcript_22761/g.64652 Transcript_22761/m.64652 type:complete len:225 (-) Transcript_22761:491-1165(-)
MSGLLRIVAICQSLEACVDVTVDVPVRSDLECTTRRFAKLLVSFGCQTWNAMHSIEKKNNVPLYTVTPLQKTGFKCLHAADAAELSRRVRVQAIGDQVHTDGNFSAVCSQDICLHHLPHEGPLAGAVPGLQQKRQVKFILEVARFEEQSAQHFLCLNKRPSTADVSELLKLCDPSKFNDTDRGTLQIGGQFDKLRLTRSEARLIPPELFPKRELRVQVGLVLDH